MSKEYPRFVSRSGQPVLLALLSGHTMSVDGNEEGTPVPPKFQTKALLSGCVPVAMLAAQRAQSAEENDVDDPNKRNAMIDAQIEKMVAETTDNPASLEANFTAEGKPSVDALSSALGTRISGGERDAAWERYELSHSK